MCSSDLFPSHDRGVFSTIFWKPAIQWAPKKIEILNPIKFTNVKRNERNRDGSVCQRNSVILKDVAYRLYAELIFIPVKERPRTFKTTPEHFEEENINRSNENPEKYNSIFERRAKNGQCFNTPYLGC